MTRLVRAGFAAVGMLIVLDGCETNPPELYELEWILVDFDDRELDRTYERLSLFVRPGDTDGLDDLDELYVIFDAEELFWRLTADTWTRDVRDRATWIGTASLAMPGEQPFPAGEYRVLLIDAGGERDSSRFVIPRQRSATPLPEVEQDGATFTVRGAARYRLWVVAEGTLRDSIPIDAEIDLNQDDAYQSGMRYEVYVFGKRPAADKGALSGPYFWQPQ